MPAESPKTMTGEAPGKPSGLRIHLANIYRLATKELRSIRADPTMLILVVYAFSLAIYTISTGAAIEARNLTIGVVDEDRSDLSRQIFSSFHAPLFKRAVTIRADEIDSEMDHGRLVFVLEIPPLFQADLLSRRRPSVQLNVDATAMTQAGNGAVYIQSIIAQEVADFLARRESSASAPFDVVVRAKFNPNLNSSWFAAVMQVINNITMLTIILTGAALIRERELGTVEHLLVMPVKPAEIMLAKIVANGLVILVAACLSLVFVVQWWLQVPIQGSLPLFLGGSALYAFTVAALGILLGTFASSMGQFGLLAIPIFVVMQLLSGSTTPMESMPVWLRYIMQTISPTPHFVAFSQAVLYRGADLSLVWQPLLAIVTIGSVYFAVAISRFRRVIFGS